MKALGTGIGFEVSCLDFNTGGRDLTPDKVTCSTTLKVDSTPAADWLFEETMLDDHCVAVATRPDRPDQVCEYFDRACLECNGKGSQHLQQQ